VRGYRATSSGVRRDSGGFGRPADEPRAMFDTMSDLQRDSAHDAFIATLTLGQGLQHPEPDDLIRHVTFQLAASSVSELLDELVPYVSYADDALRRTLLDGEPLATALARIANAK
jgi:hypothetical protein